MKKSVKAFGVLGGTAAACVACCAGTAFMLPMVGWLGLTGFGAIATGWYWPMAGIFALAIVALIVRRSEHVKTTPSPQTSCGCTDVQAQACGVRPK